MNDTEHEQAIRFALLELENMTSEEFAHGADRPLRDRLARALGYSDGDDFYSNAPR